MALPLLWLNGRIVEEADARISPFDRGFLWGDGAYEITPCVGTRPFRLDRHLDRLYRSLRYAQIDPGIAPADLELATLELLEANAPRLQPDGQYRLGHFVTRGEDSPTMLARDAGPATACVFMRPVDLSRFGAALREGGVRLALVPTRRTPAPGPVTARLMEALSAATGLDLAARALVEESGGADPMRDERR